MRISAENLQNLQNATSGFPKEKITPFFKFLPTLRSVDRPTGGIGIIRRRFTAVLCATGLDVTALL